MKSGFQKVKLNRKTSAKSNSSKQVEPHQEEKGDKLSQLKVKIERQRDAMRQSGKRFHKGASNTSSSVKLQTQELEKKVDKTENTKFSKKQRVAQVSVGQETIEKKVQQKPIVKDSIDLTSLIVEEKEVSMSSSRIFEQQISQQKNRNKEVLDFLNGIELGQYAEGLINLGYDELDVLMEVTCEQLNFLMMRAAHQRILTSALKQYKQKNGISETKAMDTSFAKTSSLFHVKIKNEAVKQKKLQRVMTQMVRPKSAITVASTANNSGLFSDSSNVKPNPSFFIGIGGQDWSMDSLVRRACTNCFKVLPGGEMIQEQGVYYCVECKKKEDDPLSINMNNSMIRDYKL